MTLKRQVLVTGGAGFIGSHLVEALLSEGHSVRVVDNLATGYKRNLDHLQGFEFIDGDVSDFDVCREVTNGVDTIFHLAAIPSVPRSVREPLESHLSGATATLNMLEAGRQAGAKRFVFSASSSAYGDTEELPKHEGIMPHPLSPYAASKLAGEHYVEVYAQTMGLDGINLRYFNIFGPRQDPSSPYSGVISLFINAMVEGKTPTILGDGMQTRDFTYVANVVTANILAMKATEPLKGTVVNVGTGERISLIDLVATINNVLGTSIQPEFKPPRAGDVLHSLADLTRVREVLGYEPTVKFAEGLAKTIESMVPSLQ